jgi:hypothetical protein
MMEPRRPPLRFELSFLLVLSFVFVSHAVKIMWRLWLRLQSKQALLVWRVQF